MFLATCREPGCLMHESPAIFADYLDRQLAVGEHRVSTGHTVDMAEAPVSD